MIASLFCLAASLAQANGAPAPFAPPLPPSPAAASGIRLPLPSPASVGGDQLGIPNTRRVPQDVAAADFNGDGIQDLAIAYAFDDEVDWYFGRSDGHYDFGGSLDVGTHPASIENDLPRKLAVADFDGDGFLDLAVLCSGFPGALTAPSLGILYGLPGGGFEPFRTIPLAPAATPSPSYSTSLAVGDLDGDGALDLVVGHYNSNQISVILHDAGRRWKTAQLLSVNTGGYPGPLDLKLADVDFDGDTDLIAINYKNVQIWRGDGDGAFESPHALAGLPDASTFGFEAGALADFDRDGKWDLALLDSVANSMRIYFALGVGGTFQRAAAIPFPADSYPLDLTIADADLDGRRDAAVAFFQSGKAQWFMGQSPAAAVPFVAGRTIPTGASPVSIHAFRANADPWIDLATANQGDKDVAGNQDITIDLGVPPETRRSYFQADSGWSSAFNAAAGSRLNRPAGLAWDAASQSLWTVDRRLRQFVKLDGDGKILSRTAIAQVAGGTLADPVALACDGAGGLWVADRIAGKMVHLDSDLQSLGEFSTVAAGIARPTAAAYDILDGKLYVADDLAKLLVAFDASGAVLASWDLADVGYIRALGWDELEGALWAVRDRPSDRLAVLSLPIDDSEHPAPGEAGIARTVDFTSVPAAMASGAIRSIAPDSADDRLWILTDGGALLRLGYQDRHVETTAELALFRSVAAAAAEPGGTILVADGGPLGTIARLSAAGDRLSSFSLAQALGRPVRIAGLARSADEIFVLDALARQFIVLSPAFDIVRRFGNNALGHERLQGLAYNAGADMLLVGVPGAVVEISAQGPGPSSLPQLNSNNPPMHPVSPDRPAGSIARAGSLGAQAIYDAASGELDFYDAQWSPGATLAERRGFSPGFEGAGATPLNDSGTAWLFYGAGDAPLVRAALVNPANAAGGEWTLYR